jgi:hypothetical protein
MGSILVRFPPTRDEPIMASSIEGELGDNLCGTYEANPCR